MDSSELSDTIVLAGRPEPTYTTPNLASHVQNVPPAGHAQVSKRMHYVSQACNECKKRKVKCSGHQPGPCRRCSSSHTECVYGSGRKKRRRATTNGQISRSSQPRQTTQNTEDSFIPSPQRPVTYNGTSDIESNNNSIQTQHKDISNEDILTRLRRLEALAMSRYQSLMEQPASGSVPHPAVPGSAPPEEAIDGVSMLNLLSAEQSGHQSYGQDSPASIQARHDTETISGTAFTDPKAAVPILYPCAFLEHPSFPQCCETELELWSHQASAALVHDIRSKLQTFFEQLNPYCTSSRKNHPSQLIKQVFCLNQAQFFAQLDEYIQVQGLHTPGDQAIEFVALVKTILAFMSVMQDDCPESSTLPGWDYYCQSAHLLRHTTGLGQGALLTVQCFFIRAVYLITAEEHNAAYEAIGQAVRLCYQNQLHDQRSWHDYSPFVVHMRQRVFWSVYVLEKSISQLCGVPYLIRESDINVDLPAALDDRLLGASEELPEETPWSSSCPYLGGLVQHARLTSEMWDKLFSRTAARPVDAEAIAILDARILYMKGNLPSLLQMETATNAAQNETHAEYLSVQAISLQLLVNHFRLLLQREDVAGPMRSVDQCRTCLSIARTTVELACALYQSGTYPAFQRFMCVTFVAYAIIAVGPVVLADQGQLEIRKEAAATVAKAFEVLEEIAPGLGVARSALKKLSRTGGLREKVAALLASNNMPVDDVVRSASIGTIEKSASNHTFDSPRFSPHAYFLEPLAGDSPIRLLYTPALDARL